MNDPYAKLRAKFVARCDADRRSIAAARSSWRQAPHDADHELARLVHGLSGAGGTFGFAEVSRRAEAVETAWIAARPPAEMELMIAALLDELERVAGEAGLFPG